MASQLFVMPPWVWTKPFAFSFPNFPCRVGCFFSRGPGNAAKDGAIDVVATWISHRAQEGIFYEDTPCLWSKNSSARSIAIYAAQSVNGAVYAGVAADPVKRLLHPMALWHTGEITQEAFAEAARAQIRTPVVPKNYWVGEIWILA